MRVMVGMGCDRGASLQTLQQALQQALELAGLAPESVTGLASIDKKNDETALLQLAAAHGWPLLFYPATELAAVEVPNPSAVVLKHMGTPAVAEAAAIKAAHGSLRDLLIEKHKYLGADGKNATVSIARMA
ncbi:MAG: cobalamin biosynthesis protein [Methylomonas sp.]|nr:cobalamin biosynthesis protein [Methylomonas sp.]PPD19397.1 MAG: cobalamin biosynthesis protein CbiG [Methylomonas sp.]PPD24336.1 MAG: cobalamin biosynthesis protein CbiG [Methylomonas sp.]PPD32888.1 MAG: cobalamin biosynthesis protein CbiG [Methylomonas sp.]PPD54046.1 MAG: cobalamin biosynthesis protein CbiG [Methylomonas sp.]